MNPQAGQAAHKAVTVFETLTAAGAAAALVAVALAVIGLVAGWPTFVLVCLLATLAGAAARLALEVPTAVRGLRDQHTRAHRWINDHTTKELKDTTTRKGSGVLQEGVEQSETTDDELRSLNVQDRQVRNGNERSSVTGTEGAGRFPGLNRAPSCNRGNGNRHPNGQYQATGTDRERFWAQVDTTNPAGCWHWTGSVNADGYGLFKPQQARAALRAHRWAYEQLTGHTPVLPLDHLCHTTTTDCAGGTDCPHRRCVNPDHLEQVTAAENARRARTRLDQENQP